MRIEKRMPPVASDAVFGIGAEKLVSTLLP